MGYVLVLVGTQVNVMYSTLDLNRYTYTSTGTGTLVGTQVPSK